MNLNRIFVIFVLLVIFPTFIGAVNVAQAKEKGRQAEQSNKRSKISAQQAASIVKSRFGGKVLKVQSSGNGYRVKLVKPDGRILSVSVDGQTGRIKG